MPKQNATSGKINLLCSLLLKIILEFLAIYNNKTVTEPQAYKGKLVFNGVVLQQ
jgi:hypothetical protein